MIQMNYQKSIYLILDNCQQMCLPNLVSLKTAIWHFYVIVKFHSINSINGIFSLIVKSVLSIPVILQIIRDVWARHGILRERVSVARGRFNSDCGRNVEIIAKEVLKPIS